jgi:CheY-like chemotaxis protein
MGWVERGQSNEGRRMLVVENDSALVRALERALPLSFCAMLVSPHDSVTDVLTALREKSATADVLYLDAQLVYQECPNPSYYGGLELVKHIRLTPSLEPLSLLPIVIGTVDTPTWLLQQAADNVLIFSPGCEAVKLPLLLEHLRRAFHRHRRFPDEQAMHQAVRPYVLFTDADERMRVHSYLNRVGVGRFLKEFAGCVIDEGHPQFQQYQRMMRAELWLKKMHFLRPELRSDGTVGRKDAEELWDECRNHCFIYVDDEHRYGWSLGLYAGLFGQTADPTLFEQARSVVETPDQRLLCIDSYDEAVSFFNTKAKRLNQALQAWSEAEFQEWKKSQEEARARHRLNQATQELNRAKRNFENAEQNQRSAEDRYRQLQYEMREHLKAFGSRALDLAADIETLTQAGDVLDVLQREPPLKPTIELLNRLLDDHEQAYRIYQQAKMELEQAEQTLRMTEQKWQQTEQEFKQAQRGRAEAGRSLASAEMQLNQVFPYSLVFLDLRLKQPIDELRGDVEEITGMKLLVEVKRLFPHLPVIVMTASEKAPSAEKARELGADGYWIKGISPGNRLRSAIHDCLEKAKLRKIWLDIKKVESKKEIHCFEWKAGRLEPRVLGERNLDRMLIERWLEESFLLLQQGSGIKRTGVHDSDYPYDHVILNMGLIQELRYKNLRDQDWGARSLDEQELRTRRNEVAHPLKSDRRGDRVRALCTREEAIKFLQFTLDRLLKQRHGG